MKYLHRFIQYFDRHEYTLLIGSLLFLLIVYPFTLSLDTSSIWIHGSISLVLITGMYAASTFKKFFKTSLSMGGLAFFFLWIEYLTSNEIIYFFYILTGLGLFVFITSNLIKNLSREQRVTPELIFGAVAGYMTIGLLSAFIYACIIYFIPGSISGVDATGLESFPQLIYFSYVNMTTVGYGDMIPVSAHAQSWSIISTIAGQMYLTILIGVIVGKYIRKGSK